VTVHAIDDSVAVVHDTRAPHANVRPNVAPTPNPDDSPVGSAVGNPVTNPASSRRSEVERTCQVSSLNSGPSSAVAGCPDAFGAGNARVDPAGVVAVGVVGAGVAGGEGFAGAGDGVVGSAGSAGPGVDG